MRHRLGAPVPVVLAAVLWLAAACAPSAAPAPAKPAAAVPAAATAVVPAAAAAPAPATGQPALVTTPRVDVKVGVLPVSSYGAHYIARARGYFDEVGLNVDFISGSNVNELLPALTQGQLHIGACSNSIGCFNAMNRRTDMVVVADLSSTTGPSTKSDASSLVVRKDVWDAGTIREPRDLVGRQIYNIAGQGSGHHGLASRWLLAQGIDPRGIEWPQMTFPDIHAAMQNRGIELAIQTEPLLRAGLARGVYASMANSQDMHRQAYLSYLMYHQSIDRLGPQVGERFMVAFLRGLRDYINGFEYGLDQDAIIDILTKDTVLKDPELYRQTNYNWADPNGDISQAALQADADLFLQLGVATSPIDLTGMFEDKYRKFAVQHLGEYRPPR